jgi:hypothetical protein
VIPGEVWVPAESSYLQDVFDNNQKFVYMHLSIIIVTGNTTENPCVRSKSHDVIIPVHEQKSIQDTQSKTMAPHIIGKESTETCNLTNLWTINSCCFHTIVYINLQIEKIRVGCTLFGKLVKEVMQEKKMLVETG